MQSCNLAMIVVTILGVQLKQPSAQTAPILNSQKDPHAVTHCML